MNCIRCSKELNAVDIAEVEAALEQFQEKVLPHCPQCLQIHFNEHFAPLPGPYALNTALPDCIEIFQALHHGSEMLLGSRVCVLPRNDSMSRITEIATAMMLGKAPRMYALLQRIAEGMPSTEARIAAAELTEGLQPEPSTCDKSPK